MRIRPVFYVVWLSVASFLGMGCPAIWVDYIIDDGWNNATTSRLLTSKISLACNRFASDDNAYAAHWISEEVEYEPNSFSHNHWIEIATLSPNATDKGEVDITIDKSVKSTTYIQNRTGNAGDIDIDIDAAGDVHIAYSYTLLRAEYLGDPDLHIIKYLRQTQGVWQPPVTVLQFMATAAFQLDIAVDSSGTPHIAIGKSWFWLDGNNNRRASFSIFYWNPSLSAPEGLTLNQAGSLLFENSSLSIALDSAGIPAVAYFDAAGKVMYFRYNGDSSWTDPEVFANYNAGAPMTYGSGAFYIALHDATNKYHFKKRNGLGVWSLILTEDSDHNGRIHAICVDEDNSGRNNDSGPRMAIIDGSKLSELGPDSYSADVYRSNVAPWGNDISFAWNPTSDERWMSAGKDGRMRAARYTVLPIALPSGVSLE